MPEDNQFASSLDTYCEKVREVRRDPAHSPEESLYRYLEKLIDDAASILDTSVTVVGEYNEDGVGTPDIGVNLPGGSTAYIEAKPPDASLGNFTGREKEQFERYQRLDNLIYTNFWRLKLYREGKLVETERLVPSTSLDPGSTDSISGFDVQPGLDLLRRFFSYESPSISTVPDLSERLARATRLVRDAVEEAMSELGEGSPLHEVYGEFDDILFSDLSTFEFADAYAQTLSYGLLFANRETEDELRMSTAPTLIEGQNTLLSATLRLLSTTEVTNLVGWTTENLLTIINSVEPQLLEEDSSDTGDEGGSEEATERQRDPLLYFYEDFLEEYDPQIRKESGVYYTPQPVVDLQTRVINHLLQDRFERTLGFADEDVHTLDPAVGTGTYLISALEKGAERIEEAVGASSVPDLAGGLAKRLNGFEILVGPYSVSHFRLAAAVENLGGEVNDQLPITLTDTLERAAEQPNLTGQFGFMSKPITDERERANQVKRHEPVMVILGNPPYKRGEAKEGWVWDNLLESFRDPVRDQYSGDFKNMADPYVSFYKWAHWKLFKSEGAPEKGVLSFITNRKWLQGGWAGGMRKVFRKDFDDIYVIDLHGDNRSPLPAGVDMDDNVFNVQVGVAITVMVADGSRGDEEARVHYVSKRGEEKQKKDWLDSVDASLPEAEFTTLEREGVAPFRPRLSDQFESWPCLDEDVFDFSHSGVQTKRDHLAVGPTSEKLASQIREFYDATGDRKTDLFHETGSRSAAQADQTSFEESKIIPYGYRPLDRQFLYDRDEFLDRRRPSLQDVWGNENRCLFTLPEGHGEGPTVFLQTYIPDIHAYRGSYGGYAFPLWDKRRESGGQQSLIPGEYHNFNDDLVSSLSDTWNGRDTDVEELFAYVYAVLSAPGYTLQFSEDLAQSFPRVPFPSDSGLYHEGVSLGEVLLQLHSMEKGYPADGSLTYEGQIDELETAEYQEANKRVKLTDDGSGVGPVPKEVWGYSVSGYEVLEEWIERREGIDFDQSLRFELLDVIWILQETVELSDDLDDFLDRVLQGEILTRDDLGVSD